ncbi:hypothetical protein CLU85_1975 [Acidovorax sp. 69]|uniref:hypothetical protein n=1 Tax=Acidovorax sp. 69 TaxID=2035202 RepID=UPI000C250B7E|nr:hypothetical protein [Acidovorax sp. 69]PJI97201.1 hypothetical protein CLU85_1975 [Acidovorax sp. 69]
MLLQKTEKARLELSPGVRTLSLRERSLLLLADGKPLSALQAMYNGIGAQIVENLMRQGYLTGPADLPVDGAATVTDTASPTRTSSPVPALLRPEPGESLRSLAGARMYLFDTCERLFSRRDPVLAQHFREALRGAKDRTSMLDVGDAMFEEVALAAGAERSASLRERLEQLLPTVSEATYGAFAHTQPALLD